MLGAKNGSAQEEFLANLLRRAASFLAMTQDCGLHDESPSLRPVRLGMHAMFASVLEREERRESRDVRPWRG